MKPRFLSFISLVVLSAAVPSLQAAVFVNEDGINVGPNSGSNANSVGWGSVAIGEHHVVDTDSLAVGVQNNATLGSLAGGYTVNLAAGSAAETFAFGDTMAAANTLATTLLGQYNYVNWNGTGTPSAGYDTASLLAGSGNTLGYIPGTAGSANILLGKNNNVYTASTGSDSAIDGSVLLGVSNTSTRSESWILGKGNIGQSGTVILGKYNDAVSSASLIVGTGTGTGARSNGLVVLNNGNVTVSGTLSVGGSPAVTTSYLSTNHYAQTAMGTSASVSSGGLAAWGSYSQASASNAVAMGEGANSSGSSAVSFGYHATASGDRAVAFSGSSATGFAAVALGGAASSGYGSIGIGEAVNAVGDASIAIGSESSTGMWCNNSVAIGKHAAANSLFAVSVGSWTTANGFASTALGSSNTANGDGSSALGTATIAQTYASTTVGAYNTAATGHAGSWYETEAIFEVGNGADSTHRSNAITTLKNGRTTLANKYWVSSTPTVVPSSTDATSGTALAVEGHTDLKGNAQVAGKTTLNGETTVNGKTVLNGDVIMANAQGDISMGIYN